jgi:DNA-directed RNA polymerase I, II, and III subunit RPABC2
MSATKDNNESYFDNYDIEQSGGASDSDSSSSDSDSDDGSDTSSSSDSASIGGGVLDEVADDLDVGGSIASSDAEDSDSDDNTQTGGGGDDPDYPDVPDYEEQGNREEEQRISKSGKKIKKIPAKKIVKKAFSDEIPDDDDDEDEDGEMYLKKFDKEVNDNYILNNHPECAMQNYDEILAMTKVVRDSDNIVIDDLHRTNPFLTKYERARILGQRAKQIETGATPFVKVPENIIDSYLIAEMELQQGRIPFIIRRPLPNGGSEYWKINDLENIAF